MTTRAKTVYARVAGSVAVPDDPAIRRATALVVVILCLLAAGEAGYGASNGGAGEALTVLAMIALPLLYVVPASNDAARAPLAAVGRTGSGLGNLSARVADAGSHLAAGQNGGQFSLVAEIPLLLHITTTASRLP